MCGLSGYYKSDILESRLIQGMTDIQHHRGPDHTGYFEDDRICLGHNRLKIIDLSEASNQPFRSEDGRFVMIYNGEVYNFKQVQEQLAYRPKTSGDTEIVLQAYLKWGDDFVNKLNGMFAIAIYDTISGDLNIWRDRFGIKPLCYYYDGKHFAFASEMKALYSLPFEKNLNREALSDYLFLEYIPSPKSIFEHFHKLPAGHKLTYQSGSLKVQQYYNILDNINIQDGISEKQALEQWMELFERSVQRRGIADVPLGAFLSGGLDSSSIVKAMFSNRMDISTFTISFDDERFDESKYAEKAANKYLCRQHHYKMMASELLRQSQLLFQKYDEPFAVSSIFPTHAVSQMAAKEIKVALSGDGGDELFMGYGHYKWRKRLDAMPSFVRLGLSSILSFMPQNYQRVGNLLNYRQLSKDWPHVWSQDQYMFTEKEVSQLLSNDYKNETLRSSWESIQNRTPDPYLQVSLFDIKHYLADDLLYKVDIASMANSLEVRLPFLDHHLLEYSINLPTRLKINGKEQKFLLRSYLSSDFDRSFTHREKRGFGTPIDRWLNEDLSELMNESLKEEQIRSDGIFDPSEVRKLIDSYRSGKSYLNKRIWALLTFHQWKRYHWS